MGADHKYRLPVRVINELAWHSLFARTMFISNSDETEPHKPKFTSSTFRASRLIHNATAPGRQRSS